MKNVEIDYSSNVLDTQELDERLDYLTSVKDVRADWMDAKRDAMSDEEIEELEDNEPEEFTDEMEKELDALEEAKSEVTEWRDGNTLVNLDYWTEYCKELTMEIGELPKNLASYIENNIDWDGVAVDLSVDYSTIDIMGNTFYYRNC